MSRDARREVWGSLQIRVMVTVPEQNANVGTGRGQYESSFAQQQGVRRTLRGQKEDDAPH